jgi:hypothetical protein
MAFLAAKFYQERAPWAIIFFFGHAAALCKA